MIVLTRGEAAVLATDLPTTPDASPAPTVEIHDGAGDVYLEATELERDTTSALLVEPAAARTRSLAVDDVAGLVPGTTYVLGDAASDTPERVVVRRLRAPDVELGSAISRAHAAGSPLRGVRVSVALDADDTGVLLRYGRARIRYAVSGAGRVLDLPIAVAQHAHGCRVGPLELLRRDEDLLTRLSPAVDLEDRIALARADVDTMLGLYWEPWLQRGTSDAYDELVTWRALELLALTDRPDQAERYRICGERVLRALVAWPVDRDEDNALRRASTEGDV